MVSHCYFNLQFPDDMRVEHLFPCLLAICISSSELCLFRSLVNFLINSFMGCTLLSYLKSYHHIQDHLDSLLLLSRSFIVLHFTHSSMIHFDLIRVKNIRSLSRFLVSFNLSSLQHPDYNFLIHCLISPFWTVVSFT